MTQTLDLALIGNGTIGALVSPKAEIVWLCLPRFDGDPVFCSLLRGEAQPPADGAFAVELIGAARIEQAYVTDTAILVTREFDAAGGGIQITDVAPRFVRGEALYGTLYAPMMLLRRIETISGSPTIRIRLRPMQGYGAERITPLREPGAEGMNRVRFRGKHIELLLTTDAPVDAIIDETPFELSGALTLCLGSDEEAKDFDSDLAVDSIAWSTAWWHEWVGSLSFPPDWRDDVARAAITLKLNVAEDTGAIIAAMTTSIPEAPNSGRTWDYRYSWLRDAYFVADALYRVGDSVTRARFVDWLMNIVSRANDQQLAPLYTIAAGTSPRERTAPHLPGYRGMGPVRVGNQAAEQVQHDIYGEAILTTLPLFTNPAAAGRGDVELFAQLEPLGNLAAANFDKPDAGLWELRGKARVHTFSSVMCWAGCNALAQIAAHLNLDDRAAHWRAHAENIHRVITERSWNPALGAFTAAMEGDTLDASLLLMEPLGFLTADDPQYVATVGAIGRNLRRGDFIYRYIEKDDFGAPENAFLVCTFWYIDALAAIGAEAEARRLFENLLSCRNRHGLLAEDLDPVSREQWGNFVQTYSMAGIITSALRLTAE